MSRRTKRKNRREQKPDFFRPLDEDTMASVFIAAEMSGMDYDQYELELAALEEGEGDDDEA